MRERRDNEDRSLRLDEVLVDYLQRIDQGKTVSEAEYIQANPEIADQLRSYFNNEKVFDVPGVAETTDFRNEPTPQNALRVRCPNCHTIVNHAVDREFSDLTCESCGSHFSLVNRSEATKEAETLKKIGRFELIERLGVGGFGTVWKARDTELDRTVAVKIPRRGELTTDEVEKFLREARAAAQLQHSNIVRVHEVGRDGDSVYIVSDFIRGVDLSDWLSGQQLTSREAAELIAKVSNALHHAHEQGVIHRDLKPANIMMDGEGEPHLMDFGLARREVGEVTVTVDGQVLGTPAYMSPEQAQGAAHTADRRSDIYSMGTIFFELLTGERPFRGNARMLLHQVIHEPAPSPRKLNATVHRDLETITLKCLEKEPGERYQSAGELTNELQRYLRGEPILARPLGSAARTWRWCRRKPATAALLFLTIAFAAIGPTIAVVQTQLRMETNAAKEQAETERNKALSIAEQRRKQAFCSDLRQAKYLFDQDAPNPRIAELLLRNNLPEAQEDTARFEYRALCDLVFPEAPELTLEEPGRDIAVAVSGSRMAALAISGKIVVWDLKNLRQICSFRSIVTGCTYLSLDAQGRRVAIGHKTGEVELWNADSCKLIRVLRGLPRQIDNIRFVAGSELVTVSYSGSVEVWATDSGENLSSLTFDTTHLVSENNKWLPKPTCISPGGQWVALGGCRTQTMVWSRADNSIIRTLVDDKNPYDINGVCGLSFGRNSDSLVSFHTYGTAISYTIPEFKPKRIRKDGGASQPRNQAIHLGSSQQFIGVNRTGVLSVSDFELNYQYSRKILPETWDTDISCGQSLDGDCYAVLDKQSGKIAILNPLSDIQKTIVPARDCYKIAWCPQSRFLAIASSSQPLSIWDCTDGAVDTVEELDSPARGIAYSPDGTYLAYSEAAEKVSIWDVSERQVEANLSLKTLGAELYSQDGDILHAVPLAFHPHNPSEVFIGFGSGQVIRWNFVTDSRQLVHDTRGLVKDLNVSSDGRFLLVSSWKTGTFFYDLTLEKLSEHYTDGVITCAVTPDSDSVVLPTDGRVRIANRGTSSSMQLYGHESHVSYVSFCNSDRGLVTKDAEKVRFWNLDTGECTFASDCASSWYSAAMSQDKSMLAYAVNDRHIRVLKPPRASVLQERMSQHATK